MAKIKNIYAREIFDSRGNPTIETTVVLADEKYATSSVPSGVSKGSNEAVELRDSDPQRFAGLGVLKAVDTVNNTIAPKIIGMDASEQQKIDRVLIEMDGTSNKSNLGANSILSISQAVIKAAAVSAVLPLGLYIRQFANVSSKIKIPIPMFNLIEGGKHGGQTLNFQEFLVVPATSKSYAEALKIGITCYQNLKKILYDRGESVLVADEGGFSPNITTNQQALALIKQAIEASNLSFSLDAFIGLDIAANSFAQGKTYRLADRSVPYSSDDMLELYKTLVSDFSLIYVEDPYAEGDLDAWKKMYSTLSDKTLIVGDDLITTNPYRLEKALEEITIGGVVIKPNQIGTVTEAIAVAEIARFKGLKLVVSHRGGETEDTFIADFAVGIGADYVKFGAPARERMIKYNRLLAIEEELKAI